MILSRADGLKETGGYRVTVLTVRHAAADHELERSEWPRCRGREKGAIVFDSGLAWHQLEKGSVEGMALVTESAPQVG